MDEKEKSGISDFDKRKLDAYKKTAQGHTDPSEGDAGSDWLSQLAASDINNIDDAPEPKKNAAAAAPLSFNEKAAAFAKLPRTGKTDRDKDESKYRRVAKFLILIGAAQASKVLANLEEDQVEKITAEVAQVRGITKDEASEIFAEFQGLLAQSYGPGGTSGGIEEARKLLYAAFGKEKGEAFFRRAVPSESDKSFTFLEDFSGEQVAMLLRDETPATGALILSRIDPKVSATALKNSDPKWRLETMRRIGHISQVSPEVLISVAAALKEKARNLGSTATADLDGMSALAAILKNADISFGDKILKDLGEDDPELSRNLKERLYTLEDVIKAENRPIQEKLHSMQIHDIAVLIKGREETFAEKVLSNMSSGRRAEVRDELTFMGPITKKDSDAALKLFMQWFRNEREAGNILIEGDEDLVQ